VRIDATGIDSTGIDTTGIDTSRIGVVAGEDGRAASLAGSNVEEMSSWICAAS
jgi:hypothetical protein